MLFSITEVSRPAADLKANCFDKPQCNYYFNHCNCKISKTQWTCIVIYTDFWAMVGISYMQFACFVYLVSEALFRQIRAKTQKCYVLWSVGTLVCRHWLLHNPELITAGFSS